MKTGKIPESILKRSILKQVKVHPEKRQTAPGVGMDVGVGSLGTDEYFVMSTAPVSGTRKEIGRKAIRSVANNIAAAGADPVGIMVTILLPPRTEEAVLRDLMKEISGEAKESGMTIFGGHTETLEAVTEPVISMTGIGKTGKDTLISAAGAKVGDEIVLTKYAGLSGTGEIATGYSDLLEKRYPLSFIEKAQELLTFSSVTREAQIARECEITAMHDVSECGLFGALWELAAASKVGLEIELSKVPIKQHTVEVCEFFDLNPYMLRSMGCLLITAPNGNEVVTRLEEAGIPGAVIGRIREDQDKIVIYGEDREKRFLEPPRRDEIYKIATGKENHKDNL